MTHAMNLHPRPFGMIRNGTKTIELRLYDERRRLIRVGDTIVFTHSDSPAETISTQVTALHVFDDFGALYRALPLEKCGYLPEELASASPEDMDLFYSADKQARYGVVGIELKRIEKDSL